MYDCQTGEIERICLQITVCGGNVAQASLDVFFNEILNVFKFKICKGRLEEPYSGDRTSDVYFVGAP